MRIVIGSLQCEGNSLTPVLTRFEDFDYLVGDAMLDPGCECAAVLPMLRERDCEIIPTVYGHALPGGPVKREDFLKMAGQLLDAIPPRDVDGVWLYLHGAMCVEDIGSGDTYIVRAVREKVGTEVPISIAMDFHADNTDEIVSLSNCITGFRTAPHSDRAQTQIRAMELLFEMIDKKILPTPQIARANVVICGDIVQTALEPLKRIMELADRMERTVPGLLCCQVFNGQPWVDAPYMGPNFVVTHISDNRIAMECAEKLAKAFYDARHDFQFLIEAEEPMEALRLAMEAGEDYVFVSDSGDNTTAGAVGDNAFMINRVLEAGAENVLIAGIADAPACRACYRAEPGQTLTLTVGGTLDSRSEKAQITGRLIHKGDLLSYTGGNAGPSATLDCGNMTVVITENRAAMCRPEIFASIGLDFKDYKITVVKLGYLFPELAAQAQRSILAFTPGASTERLQDMHLKNIRRPMFPLDDNFM